MHEVQSSRQRHVLLSLLHVCDSLFPIGSFGHSDGLESAVASGLVTDGDGLSAWLGLVRDESFGRCEGPAIVIARSAVERLDWGALVAVDREVDALKSSSTMRAASQSMGLRLVKTWHGMNPDARLERMMALARARTLGPTLPVAFAAVTECAGAEVHDGLAAFAYTRLATTVSAAMRLFPIGQSDAHQRLSRSLEGVPALVDALLADGRQPESFAPALDIAQMTQQYVHARLFRS